MNLKLLMVIIILVRACNSIKVYQSTLPVNTINPMSGLRFLRDSAKMKTNFDLGLSLCGRFNYRAFRNGPMIFSIGIERKIAYLKMRLENNLIRFGGLGWIIKNLEENSFRIWEPNTWYLMCMSYNKKEKHLIFIMVG